MSRLGKKPLQLPNKVKVEFKNSLLEIDGPLGKLIQPIDKRVAVKVEGNNIFFSISNNEREDNMLHGLIRGLVKNAFEGVTKGFKKNLEIHGLGFKAAVEGNNITMTLGFSHPVTVPIPEGIKIAVEKNTLVSVSGIDKALVGEFAASLRDIRKPEPYKGTGIRYAGEHIIKKAGKTAAVGAAAAVGSSGGGAKK
ncbi:MAG: 50S ribosomal protein L6 [Elusimicrobia bacterium]|nr:50S ribosomal protein L6 [Elusimicrobiota bacterium]